MRVTSRQVGAQLLGEAFRPFFLAFSHHATLPPDTPDTEEQLHDQRELLEKGLIFDGFVAIRDPIRDDVNEAIKKLEKFLDIKFELLS